MLHRLFVIAILTCLAACAEEEPSAEKSAPVLGTSENSPIRSGRVTLINGDSLTLPFVNYYSPTLAYGPDMLFLSPDSAISLAADSLFGLTLGTLDFYEQTFQFREGDTIEIRRLPKTINERRIEFPVARVVNRKVNEVELNIDYHLHPNDVDPSTLVKQLTAAEGAPPSTVLERLSSYYLRGRNKLGELRSAGRLSEQAYQRQINRLNAAVDLVASRLSLPGTVEDTVIVLDTLRVPRIRTIRDYDHRLIQLLTAHLPTPSAGGRLTADKVDDLFFEMADNPERWPKPIVEDIQFALLQQLYRLDPIRLNNRIAEYSTSFDKSTDRLSALRHRLALDTARFTVDKLLLAELSPPALLKYNGETTTLAEVFAEQDSKYILLDVWATWCRACIQDAELVQQLADSLPEVSLVNVSINADEAEWRLYLARPNSSHSLRSEQYIVADPRGNEFFTTHDITTVPRYLLVDRSGRVLVERIEGIRENPEFVANSLRNAVRESTGQE